MGNSVARSPSSILDNLTSTSTSPHHLHVVMLGLDSAGKTTALYRLKFDQYLNTVPTIGFNCERIRMTGGRARGTHFTIWDVGGQDKLRPLWRSYTRQTDGIVFVVDSVDSERWEEARVELARTARLPENVGVPLLVLANKQDLPMAADTKRLEKELALHELSHAHLWAVVPACAIIGEGLEESLETLYDMIIKRRKMVRHQPRRKRS